MAIEFNCPYCTAVIRVSDDSAGKIGRCPKCSTRLRVPQPEPPVDSSTSAAPPAGTAAPDESVVSDASPPGPPPGSGGGPPPRRPLPPENEFDAVELSDLGRESENAPQAVPELTGDATDVQIPVIPEPESGSFGPLIDTSDIAEPVYQRVTRSRQRNWTAIFAPLVCGGILVAAGLAYWWTQRETMTGELSAERLPPGTTPSAVIQRFVPNVSTDVWQASLAALGEDPVIVQSDLMVVEFSSSRRGIQVSVTAGAETDLVRVDVRRNRLLNQFCVDQALILNEPRDRELKAAATRFLEDWNNAATSGMLMGNGQDYRDPVGLNALTSGLGYHSVALVGNTLYPCVHEDVDGRLYFALPHGVDEFVVTEREFPDRDSVFPGEYRFTVRIVAPVEEPAPDEALPPTDAVDASAEEEPDAEMTTDPGTSGEAMEGAPDSGSEPSAE